MHQRYLITGGCGFMASNVIRHLLTTREDLSIVNLDKLTYAGNPANLRDVEEQFGNRYLFLKGDIADAGAVDRAIGKGVDRIINFAAETHVDRSILDPKAFLMTDVIGTYTLLEALRNHQIPSMIQISTDEVFGSTDDGVFTETSPFEPNSPYSAAKAGGDLLCRAYWKTYGTPVIVTHSCNFYGPYQYPEKLIPLFVTNLIEGKKVPLYGDGKNVREWIFTEDYCRALDIVLENAAPGDVVNIGTADRKSNLEVTLSVLAAFGKGEEMIERVADRPGHDRRYAVDAAKLLGYGWKPSVTFEQGLAKTIEWYKENVAWWKPIKNGDFQKYYDQQYAQRARS